MKTIDIALKLVNETTVDKIIKVFNDFVPDSDVKIAMHKIKSRQDAIYFIIDTQKEMSSFDIAELSGKIQEILGCDITDEEENIFIRNKRIFTEDRINQLFQDITLFSSQNFKNVQSFLEKNYLQNLKNQQEKSKEVFYTKKSSTPFFEDEKEKNVKQEVSPSLLSHEIVTQLKLNPTLWNDILASSKRATIFKKLDEEISQELKKNNDMIV